jgi:hypothetical protein
MTFYSSPESSVFATVARQSPETPRHAPNATPKASAATLTDEAKLRAMLALGVSYATACRTLGMTTREAERVVPRFEPGRPISEDEEQRRITRDVIASGGTVWSTSTKRRSKIAVGFPDVWIALPTIGMFWETKAAGGVRSEEQIKFGDLCERNGTPYGFGTHEDWRLWCSVVGVTITPMGEP